MISSKNLVGLLHPKALKKLAKALAMLDALIERDWEYRYYSFNSKWSDYEEMASMRNGQGDEWFCVFSSVGVFLKGFDHESIMSPRNQESSTAWPGVLENIPSVFQPMATEPAFSMSDTTFCIWRAVDGKQWETGTISFPDGDDPDGSAWMLAILDGNPITYAKWAEEYYDRPISAGAIEQIYQGTPLTPDLVRELNPDIEFASILADAAEIDYPVV
jgi:hypothetical protein